MSRLDGSALSRFAASVLVMATVVVAVPVGLVAASRERFGSANPLSGADPPWRWFAESTLSGPIAEDTFVDGLLRICLCAAWVAAVVIVVTTVAEVTHLVRHRGIPAPTWRGFGWAQRVARPIALGMLVVLPTATSTLSIASAISPSHPASAAQTSHASGPSASIGPGALAADRSSFASPRQAAEPTGTEPGTVPSDDTVHRHVVTAGESVYSIAEKLATAGGVPTIEVANAIVDLNLGRAMGPGERFTNPAYIQVGWTLELPARYADTPRTPSPPDRAVDPIERTSNGSSPTPAPTVHVVAPGDTLWDIAELRLGDPAAWPMIWEHNAGTVMDGGRTFDDPDLILPGWRLGIPNVGDAGDGADALVPPAAPIEHAGDASEERSDAGADLDADPPVVDGPPVVDQPSDIDGPSDLDHPITVDDAPASPVLRFDDLIDRRASSTTATPGEATPGDRVDALPPPDPAETSVPATSSHGSSTTSVPPAPMGPGADGQRPVDPPLGSAPTAPSPIRLEHAALLAAGILAVVAVRRRQRLRAALPRHRVPQPDPEVVDTERRLRAIDAGERALRIDVACRAAACALLGTGAQIGWVAASTDGAIEMQLTAPASLPAPWSGGVQRWHLGAEVPIELLAVDARHGDAPCVALVQLGVTATGCDLLVDLEACGCLAIEAEARQGDQIVTAIGAGLASSLGAEVAHLIRVGLPAAALLDHRNAHAATSPDAAFELALSLLGSTVTNDATTFELRSRHSGGEVWEPAIVLLTAADTDAAGGDQRVTPPPGRGLAVVAVAPHRTVAASTRLVAEPDGWRLVGFGSETEVTPVGLGRADLDAIDAVLRDADRELESMELTTAREITWSDSGATVRAASISEDQSGCEPFEPMPHDVIVGLLGAVEVTDREGNPGTFERSKAVELIAWLVTHRDRATRTGARTALWEMDVRDATFANVVSEARRALARLVEPPEGEEWVARTLTEHLPIHVAVVTDADLMHQRLDAARVQPPGQALETLRPAVAMIRDIPFAGTSYLWPDAEGITSNLVLLAISLTTEFSGHALSLGDTEAVFWATGQGLRVLPGHEELIALRMRAHARTGDLAGVRHEWESYERVLVADAWSDGEPSPKLLALRRELLTN